MPNISERTLIIVIVVVAVLLGIALFMGKEVGDFLLKALEYLSPS